MPSGPVTPLNYEEDLFAVPGNTTGRDLHPTRPLGRPLLHAHLGPVCVYLFRRGGRAHDRVQAVTSHPFKMCGLLC